MRKLLQTMCLNQPKAYDGEISKILWPKNKPLSAVSGEVVEEIYQICFDYKPLNRYVREYVFRRKYFDWAAENVIELIGDETADDDDTWPVFNLVEMLAHQLSRYQLNQLQPDRAKKLLEIDEYRSLRPHPTDPHE